MQRHLLTLAAVVFGSSVILAHLQKQRFEIDSVSATQPEVSEVASEVDAAFHAQWQENSVVPSSPAEPLLIARRLSLALMGTLPSLEEIRALESLDRDRQIVWWIQRVFADQRFNDYVAERLARAYVGTEGGDFIAFRRRRFVSWLSDELANRTPYDQIVRQLISDRGSWTDSPAVNFITVTNGTNEEGQPDEARLAARTTRAFLGVRLDCMQCHDDNLGGDWLQSHFHQLAAFYSEARSSGLGIQDSDREYKFKYLGDDDETTVEPRTPFLQDLEVKGETRRETLARWVTHRDNKAFARASVNRIWALMFGRPLIEPIDDIPLEGPYPPGLEILAEDFAANGFDLRRLISQIAATKVFQLSSRASHDITEQHESLWAVYPITRLRPEQVAGCIVQSASVATINSNSHILRQFISATEIGDFVKRYGDVGEDEFGESGGTIPQRLLMLNGKLVKERTKDDFVWNAATRVAQQVRNDDDAIEAAFLIVLSRRPTESERKHFLHRLQDDEPKMSRKQRFEDIFWALVNSTEFSWNH